MLLHKRTDYSTYLELGLSYFEITLPRVSVVPSGSECAFTPAASTMALVIDSTHLAESVLPGAQHFLDNCAGHEGPQAGRYQIYRVCAHATAIHGAPESERMLDETRPVHHLTNKEALDSQPDQNDDLDEAEVIHHLKQQAATSPWLVELLSLPNHGLTSSTLVTSLAVQSSSLTAQGWAIPSYRRYSFRVCMLDNTSCRSQWIFPSSLRRVIPCGAINYSLYHYVPKLSISGASSTINESPVLWHLQFDFVDLLNQRSHPAWRPTKRSRSALNRFHQLSSVPDSSQQQQHPPEAKRFNGVRYRHDRRTWSAEMKPPKYKNKVYFGDSQSQTQAARMVDAGFHYYGKPRFLNFPNDTRRELSSRVIPAGLDEECKLKFVKEQAKWLASEASKQPPSSTSVHSEVSETSSGGYTAYISRLPSLSEIVSFPSLGGDGDESDGGISSRPQPSLLPDAEAGSNNTSAYAVGSIVGISDEGHGELEWNVEDARVDAGLSASSRPSSSVRITDGWVCSAPASANVGHFSPHSRQVQEWWMNFLTTDLTDLTSTMFPGMCFPHWPRI